jgi:hypothetical protein
MLGSFFAVVPFNFVLRCKVDVDGTSNLVDEGLAQDVAIGVHVLGASVVYNIDSNITESGIRAYAKNISK